MTFSQWRSIGLHISTFFTGIVAAVIAMATSGVDLYAAYQHAYTGVKELLAAWAIIVPFLTIGFAAYKASTKQKLQDAMAAPDAIQAAREIKPTPQVVAVAEELQK